MSLISFNKSETINKIFKVIYIKIDIKLSLALKINNKINPKYGTILKLVFKGNLLKSLPSKTARNKEVKISA